MPRNFMQFEVTVSVTVENHDINPDSTDWVKEQQSLADDLKHRIVTEPRFHGDSGLYVDNIGPVKVTNWG